MEAIRARPGDHARSRRFRLCRSDPARLRRQAGDADRPFDRRLRVPPDCPALPGTREVDRSDRRFCLRPFRRPGTTASQVAARAARRTIPVSSVLPALDLHERAIPLGVDRMRLRQGVSLAKRTCRCGHGRCAAAVAASPARGHRSLHPVHVGNHPGQRPIRDRPASAQHRRSRGRHCPFGASVASVEAPAPGADGAPAKLWPFADGGTSDNDGRAHHCVCGWHGDDRGEAAASDNCSGRESCSRPVPSAGSWSSSDGTNCLRSRSNGTTNCLLSRLRRGSK